MDVNNRRTLGN